MGKNLRGGYKLIPLPIDLDEYEGQDAVVSGIYSKIKSTKKRIVLTGLNEAGVLYGDLSVEVELKSNGKLFISNAYGYDLTISSDDKVSVASHVDTSVVANPTLAGTEDELSGLEINGTKYKVSGENVVANPTLAGTEAELNGLEVGSTKYKVRKGTTIYKHTLNNIQSTPFARSLDVFTLNPTPYSGQYGALIQQIVSQNIRGHLLYASDENNNDFVYTIVTATVDSQDHAIINVSGKINVDSTATISDTVTEL